MHSKHCALFVLRSAHILLHVKIQTELSP